MRKSLASAVGAVAMLTTAAALAHHGFGGAYDRSAPIYLEGTVEQAYFGYPHAELVLRADPSASPADLPDNAAEFMPGLGVWQADLGEAPEVEFPPVRRFFDLADRIEVGDRIALIVLRNCEPPHQLRAQWVAPESGPPVVRSGRMQSEVESC